MIGGCVVALWVWAGAAQMMAQVDSAKENEALLKEALHESVLVEGKQPFHLVMSIAPAAMTLPHQRVAPASMTGTMEVWWAGPERYRLVVATADFKQTKTVDGRVMEETDEGDFYPRWLDNFVKALLEPVPEKQLPRLMAARMTGGERITLYQSDKLLGVRPDSMTVTRPNIEWPRCLETSERPGGITEETSVARICLNTIYPWYQSVLDFTRYVEFKDFGTFGKQTVPRTWSDDIPENILVEGKVTTLEKLSKEDAKAIRVEKGTAVSGQIRTVFLSRAAIEAQEESIPAFEWPAEDTEALEGYMIVYVRTDRTGKIREAYWDSSDNYKLQDAGVRLALESKLKPMLVDGAAVQMEGPMVLKFKTHRSAAAVATP
jgi:hypothetical protein